MTYAIDYGAAAMATNSSFGVTSPISAQKKEEEIAEAQGGSVFQTVDQLCDLERNDGCTDDSNDGKIGFTESAKNIGIGVLKGIGNTIKGAFTGRNGKFNPIKALFSVATAVVCCVCPAAGFVACCVGAAVAAVQVTKGIVNAAKAKTDSDKKAAFQNIGSGGLQLAASIVGAKASFGAIQSSAAAAGNGTSALQAAVKNNASFGAKAKAFWTDCKTSTNYNLRNIALKPYGKKAQDADVELNSINKANATKGKYDLNRDWDSMDDLSNIKLSYEQKASSFDNATPFGKVKMALKGAKDSAKDGLSSTASKIFKKGGNKTAGANGGKIGNFGKKLKAGFSKDPNTGKIKGFKINSDKVKAFVSKRPEITKQNFGSALKSLRTNAGKGLGKITGKLSKSQLNIFNKLTDPNVHINTVVSEYGWTNVAQVLEIASVNSMTMQD